MKESGHDESRHEEHMRGGLYGQLRDACRLCGAEARGREYDLSPALVLQLDEYLAGRGDGRALVDALARLTPNQASAVGSYAAERGGAAGGRVAEILHMLGVAPARGRAQEEPESDGDS